MCRTITVRGVAAFLVVILGLTSSGCYNTFNVTLLTLKSTYNYTLTEVEFILSMTPLGACAGLPAGVVLDSYGIRVTSAMGILTTFSGMGSMYVATLTPHFFSNKSWLLAIAFLLAGFGVFITFVVTWTTGVRQADARFRGAIIGLFKSLVLGTPAIYTLIYANFFTEGGEQNMGGYFLFLMVFILLVDVLACFVLQDQQVESVEVVCNGAQKAEPKDTGTDKDTPLTPIPQNEKDKYILLEKENDKIILTPELASEIKYDNHVESIVQPQEDFPDGYKKIPEASPLPQSTTESLPNGTPVSPEDLKVPGGEVTPLLSKEISDHIPILTLLKDSSLQFLLWILAFGLTVDSVIYANIAIICQSSYLEVYITTAMVLSRVLICTSALLSGIVLSFMTDYKKRYAYLSLGVIILMVASILMLYTTEVLSVLLLSVSMIGFGSGILWTVGAALAFAFFGARDYGRNWGLVVSVAFVVSLIFAVVFGRMYDAHVSGSNPCYGAACTKNWYIILVSLTAAALALCCTQLAIFYKRK